MVDSADLAVNALLTGQQEAVIAGLAPAEKLQVGWFDRCFRCACYSLVEICIAYMVGCTPEYVLLRQVGGFTRSVDVPCWSAVRSSCCLAAAAVAVAMHAACAVCCCGP